MNLGSWLRKTPQPHTVDVDGKKIAVPNGGGKWRDLVRTIEAMKGQQISALDSAGNIIRAMTIDESEDDKPTAAPQTDIQVFASLIAEAYDKGHKAQQPVHASALEFIERLSTRLAAAERESDRLRQEIAKRDVLIAQLRGQVIEASAGDDGEGGIIGALTQGVLAAAANGASIPGITAQPATAPKGKRS